MTKLLVTLLICMILFPIGAYFIQKYNLNYYKLNGRDPLEIQCWLKTRKWYSAFRDNIQQSVLEEYRTEDGSLHVDEKIDQEIAYKLDSILSGSFDKETISAAFSWTDTPEGTKYWGNKEYDFLKWYYGQFIDFHLFK